MLISFAVTAKLICAFVFAYADCRFSHAAAQIISNDNLNHLPLCFGKVFEAARPFFMSEMSAFVSQCHELTPPPASFNHAHDKHCVFAHILPVKSTCWFVCLTPCCLTVIDRKLMF